MFFGHRLKPGSKLKVAEAVDKSASTFVLTSACLSGDGHGAASLLVHAPDGQKLTAARLGPLMRFARLDVQIKLDNSNFAFEAVGSDVDIVGFAEVPLDAASVASKAEAQQPAAKKVEEKKLAEVKKPALDGRPEKAVEVQKPVATKSDAKKPEEKPEEKKPSQVNGTAEHPKDFITSKKFVGAKPGMVFKLGSQGQGYYKDVKPQAVKRKADSDGAPPAKKRATLQGGLKYEVVKSSSSNFKASRGKQVQVKYEGRLAMNGRRFDKGVIRFKLGAGEVIRGWDLAVDGMAVGEKRKILIPPALGYGRSGAPPDIPPNATLAFDVELLRIN
jgi:FK506-binding nuclear protein